MLLHHCHCGCKQSSCDSVCGFDTGGVVVNEVHIWARGSLGTPQSAFIPTEAQQKILLLEALMWVAEVEHRSDNHPALRCPELLLHCFMEQQMQGFTPIMKN